MIYCFRRSLEIKFRRNESVVSQRGYSSAPNFLSAASPSLSPAESIIGQQPAPGFRPPNSCSDWMKIRISQKCFIGLDQFRKRLKVGRKYSSLGIRKPHPNAIQVGPWLGTPHWTKRGTRADYSMRRNAWVRLCIAKTFSREYNSWRQDS